MSAPGSGPGPLFSLGRVLATPGALAVLEVHGVEPRHLLQRHVRGDWGDVGIEDAAANRMALQECLRIFSSYVLHEDVKVWVITEADRSATTLLLPAEY